MVTKISDLRPPIVSDADRKWALSQKPSWARMGCADQEEVCDDGGWLDADPKVTSHDERPNWSMFVSEQVERFEKFFNQCEDRLKTRGDWSRLWRNSWWQKAHPERRFPKSAPRIPQPFFRAGSPEFERAMALGSPAERRMWQQFGVAQFKPDDPRLSRVRCP